MRFARLFIVAILVAAGFAACDLNPQPLPPGTEDKAQNDDAGNQVAATAPKEDAGSSGSSGGGVSDSGSPDSGPAPPEDGGDGGDAGDGGDGGSS